MKKLVQKEDKVQLVENTKKPIFIAGVAFWVGLLGFLFASSIFNFKTGNAVAEQSVGGVSGSVVIVGLFVVLGVLLFLNWKFLIKDGKKKHAL